MQISFLRPFSPDIASPAPMRLEFDRHVNDCAKVEDRRLAASLARWRFDSKESLPLTINPKITGAGTACPNPGFRAATDGHCNSGSHFRAWLRSLRVLYREVRTCGCASEFVARSPLVIELVAEAELCLTTTFTLEQFFTIYSDLASDWRQSGAR
jgi:hypothetical protein